jgi:hemerythrin-like domain-containing protein
MRPCDVLRAEHDLICNALDLIVVAADRIEHGRPPAPAVIHDLLGFLRVFADRVHDAKEEDVLFPMLLRLRLPHPVQLLMHEHTRNHRLLDELCALSGRLDDPEAAARFIAAARRSAELRASHIAEENAMLLPLISTVLTPVEEAPILEGFARCELEELSAEERARHLDRLEEAARALRAPSPNAPAPP